jgi:hypothetical protein
MLSEHTKIVMKIFVLTCWLEKYGCERDPKSCVDCLVLTNDADCKVGVFGRDVAANREEAEQFVAGIMGLM